MYHVPFILRPWEICQNLPLISSSGTLHQDIQLRLPDWLRREISRCAKVGHQELGVTKNPHHPAWWVGLSTIALPEFSLTACWEDFGRRWRCLEGVRADDADPTTTIQPLGLPLPPPVVRPAVRRDFRGYVRDEPKMCRNTSKRRCNWYVSCSSLTLHSQRDSDTKLEWLLDSWSLGFSSMKLPRSLGDGVIATHGFAIGGTGLVNAYHIGFSMHLEFGDNKHLYPMYHPCSAAACKVLTRLEDEQATEQAIHHIRLIHRPFLPYSIRRIDQQSALLERPQCPHTHHEMVLRSLGRQPLPACPTTTNMVVIVLPALKGVAGAGDTTQSNFTRILYRQWR